MANWEMEIRKQGKEARMTNVYCAGETSGRDNIEQRGLTHTEEVVAKSRALYLTEAFHKRKVGKISGTERQAYPQRSSAT